MKKLITLLVAVFIMTSFITPNAQAGRIRDAYNKAKDKVEEVVEEVVDAVKETAEKAKKKAKSAAKKTTEAAKKTAKQATKTAKKVAKKTTEAAKKTAKQATKTAKKVAKKTTETAKNTAKKSNELVKKLVKKTKKAKDHAKEKNNELVKKFIEKLRSAEVDIANFTELGADITEAGIHFPWPLVKKMMAKLDADSDHLIFTTIRVSNNQFALVTMGFAAETAEFSDVLMIFADDSAKNFMEKLWVLPVTILEESLANLDNEDSDGFFLPIPIRLHDDIDEDDVVESSSIAIPNFMNVHEEFTLPGEGDYITESNEDNS